MELFRAVSPQELADIHQKAGFFSGPPSFQGKWFAEAPDHAAAWGRLLFQLSGTPFHVVGVDVPDAVANQMFRLPFLDRIGPARFADAALLSLINRSNRGIRELPVIILGTP